VTLTRTQVKDLLQKYDINPRKSLGQNFVVEPNTIRQIIELASIEADDFVIEVGPGIGSLTSSLLEVAGHVTAIEVDDALVRVLTDLLRPEDNRFRLVNADVMNLDVNELLAARNESWNLVANLPYNISVPLICDFLERVPVITKMTVMVQREVAERLVAKTGEKAFGLPSLKIQYFAEVKKIADVPPSVFLPKPKVDSSLVQIERREKYVTSANYDVLFELAKRSFSQRRKMLRRSLKETFDLNDFESAGIDPTQRAEDVTLEEWAALTNQLIRKQEKI
jgi:16S rRNA (adenine1518-N6/adenine1519-N6)-dimethyltransferase